MDAPPKTADLLIMRKTLSHAVVTQKFSHWALDIWISISSSRILFANRFSSSSIVRGGGRDVRGRSCRACLEALGIRCHP